MKHWPFVVAATCLGATWLVLASASKAEPDVATTPLAGFPLALEGWSGRDLEMDERVLDILKLSDYVMRAYRPVAGDTREAAVLEGQVHQSAAPVWLYVGYYASQRTGSTYHSPRNCLPGAGWQMGPIERVRDVIPGEPALEVNRVVVEKGFDKQLILYWYQDRGRVIASEYDAKLHLVWDAVTRNRTDGALVRLSTPIVGDRDAAFAHVRRFLDASWPALAEKLPG